MDFDVQFNINTNRLEQYIEHNLCPIYELW